MGKFKHFFINEEVKLSDLGPRIDKIYGEKDFEDKIQKTLQHPHWSNPSLEIPSVEKTGTIICLLKKKNPIYVRLSDGTECNFSYDEYKRIQGSPELGKSMSVTFQRHPSDNSVQYSKIEKAIVHE
jgi:hypothetical protein